MAASVEIRVFHCGQGDTLLIRLDGKKWVLVDCHLPSDGAVENFLAELERLEVLRLDLVCLSHPDADHYRGMERVLAHYCVPPRSVGIFCDAGFAGKLATALEKDRIEREIVRLYDLVFRLEEAKAVGAAGNVRGFHVVSGKIFAHFREIAGGEPGFVKKRAAIL